MIQIAISVYRTLGRLSVRIRDSRGQLLDFQGQGAARTKELGRQNRQKPLYARYETSLQKGRAKGTHN
jgi:hypothetical protein